MEGTFPIQLLVHKKKYKTVAIKKGDPYANEPGILP